MITILLVEDTPRKADAVKNALSDVIADVNGVLEICSSMVAARDHLISKQYDILVLDLMLPNRDGDDPEDNAGLSLLEEIATSKSLIRPGHIIGLTAFEELRNEQRVHFEKHLWCLIQYDQTTDEWKEILVEKILYVMKSYNYFSSCRFPRFDYDIGIVTALYDPEHSTLLRRPWEWSPRKISGEPVTFNTGKIENKGKSLRVVAAVQSHMGNICSYEIAEKIIRHFRPRLMIMLGICAGVSKKNQNYLDLVVAEDAILHDSGKWNDANGHAQFSPDPKVLSIGSPIRSAIHDPQVIARILPALSTEFCLPKSKPLQIHIGPVASGNAVIASENFVRDIQTRNRKLKGIEMESYGFAYACQNSTELRPNWVMIKSVCDFADKTKADEYQSQAASMSVRFFEEWITILNKAPHAIFGT